jgi:hypothetical protein
MKQSQLDRKPNKGYRIRQEKEMSSVRKISIWKKNLRQIFFSQIFPNMFRNAHNLVQF